MLLQMTLFQRKVIHQVCLNLQDLRSCFCKCPDGIGMGLLLLFPTLWEESFTVKQNYVVVIHASSWSQGRN